MNKNLLELSRGCWIKRIQDIWKANYNCKFQCRTGEIYEVEFGENIGDEFSGLHFAMVLQNSSPSNSKVLVVPISSRIDEYNIQFTIDVESYVGDNRITGGFVIGEAKWISKQRITKYSKIFKENENDNVRAVGYYKAPKWLIKKLANLGGC